MLSSVEEVHMKNKPALHNHQGFTLIEVMIVVAIVAILAAVAYPSYISYLRRGHRVDTEQQLMTLAQLNQQRFLDTRAYTSTVGDLATVPSSISTYYTFTITLDAGPPAGFSIAAAPQGSQVNDSCGTLTITSSGSKTSSSGTNCW